MAFMKIKESELNQAQNVVPGVFLDEFALFADERRGFL